MDHSGTKILAIVAPKFSENLNRRRGQGSSAMIVSRGLVDPKSYRNSNTTKGKQVNIPVPFSHTRKGLTHPGRSSRHACLSKRIN